MTESVITYAKWKRVLQDQKQFDDLDSDEDPDDFVTQADLQQSDWISSILRDEPLDSLYIRREDPRVDPKHRLRPFSPIRSFQKQRIGPSKVQLKYHEAEMMDIDQVKPWLTLAPTEEMFRKREHAEWLDKFYQTTIMYFQFSRIVFEKSDGDKMYSVYYSSGQSFQIVLTPPIRVIMDMVNDGSPGAYGMKQLYSNNLDQHGVAFREINKVEGFSPTQIRVQYRKGKFMRRQFMVIQSALQTFEGIVLKKANGDFEYVSGLITHLDGRIEKV